MSQQRRTFLKSIGLAGLGVTLDANLGLARPKDAASTNKEVAVAALSGKVHAGGQGIAGVVVTDGVSVTVTDAKGQYTLESSGATDFVYISVPRGYEFPHEKGVARFYRKKEPVRGRFKADFELQKLSQDDTQHNFLVWADPQMISKADAAEFKATAVPDTQKLLASYGPGTLFHGIGCGDLVWDHFEIFEDYKEGVASTGIPFFQVIGNHDMDLTARTDDHSADTFKKLFGPTYYSFNRGEIHYVVLDDVFFVGAAKKYIGYLTERQLAWLEQDLAHVKPGTTVVVSLHIPPYTRQHLRNKDKEEPMGGVVANRQELYRLLKPYKAHIMSGHTHFNEVLQTADNVTEHVHGTVCGAWWTGPICTDGTPGGYGVYEVRGSELKWYYKAIGQERSHQFRIYPKGSIPERPEALAVNVWNWDSAWKVAWFEDGVRKGDMQQYTGLDPLSVRLHAGPALPAKHKWVDPTITEHLFVANVSTQAKEIRVEVTDRFGQVYTDTLSA
ncbi:calcineurin-like phosphoesterase family protein [Hymenobacter tibetensis]|uniref:Calcineurin-like phosphoesterase family protein n=1 Tax=Hymenobacter tibetensis TaxID=497967 RepID=A0ABY4CZ93_9BACT|nr:calcineurin-like phosphoesterase family protein [Hymenobacter tibetensis]UOG75332.1 calcineurin-like phosphoesterase family protein [Hymenobacter tibetensis]